jgi:hypothetical protein
LLVEIRIAIQGVDLHCFPVHDFVVCFLSYVEKSPKTNAEILWDTGHIKRRPQRGRIGKGKE